MKVLVACEYSGVVRDAFNRLGHNAISCDLLDTESPGKHIKDNVLNHLNDGWDLMIAHPPCTHLAVSGAAWFKNKQKEQAEALDFVRELMQAPINKICIENPVSVISTKIRKPDQIIQPYYFGDPHKKTTCLWLKNLPLLKKTNEVEPKMITLKDGKKRSLFEYEASCKPKHLRGKIRSKTFEGIAQAMASQWTKPGQYQITLRGNG